VPQQAKMQAAVAAGPVSTGGVLLRLINTMIDMKMEKEVNELIFIISAINWQGTGEKKDSLIKNGDSLAGCATEIIMTGCWFLKVNGSTYGIKL